MTTYQCITPHNNIIPLCYSQPLKNIIVYTTMKDRKWWLVSFFEVLEVGLFIWRVGFGLGTTPTTASCAVSSRKLCSTMEDNVEIICFLCALESDMMSIVVVLIKVVISIHWIEWQGCILGITAACPKLESAPTWEYEHTASNDGIGIYAESKANSEKRRLAGARLEIEKPSTSQLICSRNSSSSSNNNIH